MKRPIGKARKGFMSGLEGELGVAGAERHALGPFRVMSRAFSRVSVPFYTKMLQAFFCLHSMASSRLTAPLSEMSAWTRTVAAMSCELGHCMVCVIPKKNAYFNTSERAFVAFAVVSLLLKGKLSDVMALLTGNVWHCNQIHESLVHV